MVSIVGKSKFVQTRDKVTKQPLPQPKVYHFLQTVSDFPPIRPDAPGADIPDLQVGKRVESILIPESDYAAIPVPCEAEIYYNKRGFVEYIKVSK